MGTRHVFARINGPCLVNFHLICPSEHTCLTCFAHEHGVKKEGFRVEGAWAESTSKVALPSRVCLFHSFWIAVFTKTLSKLPKWQGPVRVKATFLQYALGRAKSSQCNCEKLASVKIPEIG